MLKQFVVTADTTASASTVTVPISCGNPGGIIGPNGGLPSQYQSVNALPIDAAALTLMPGTTNPNGKTGMQGLAMHRDAFALVGVALEVPKAVELSSQARDPKTGIAVRFVKMFDPIQSRMIHRFDVLLGFGNLYPDSCSVRVAALN